MSRMHLELADGKTKYLPGETIEGVAFWELATTPEFLEVRLYWRTQGKGTVDLEIVRNMKFTQVGLQDRRPFRLDVPAAPYSVSGKLISIVWGVELVSEPEGEAANIDVVISPTGEEVRLDRTPAK
jgi:hypothetical protein